MLFDSSGITRAASTIQRCPSPSQAGQAPWALLKEKARGTSSGIWTSQRAQARCWLSRRSPRPSTETSTTPRASCSAFSRLCAQPLGGVGPQHQAVDEHVDAVAAARVERRSLSPRLAAWPSMRARCSPAARAACELLAVGALPAAGDRRRDHGHGAPRRWLDEPRRHLVGALGRDRLAAARAVRPSERREQHAQVVVDLGDGADRRARMATVVRCSIAIAGESPVTDSTSGRSICSRNWRAQGERLST